MTGTTAHRKSGRKSGMIGLLVAAIAAVAVPEAASAPATAPAAAAPPAQKQTKQDEYTRYELLAPDTASFKIDYEVTATTPGARAFWNPIRKGSVASDEAVFDLMTGAPLRFE